MNYLGEIKTLENIECTAFLPNSQDDYNPISDISPAQSFVLNKPNSSSGFKMFMVPISEKNYEDGYGKNRSSKSLYWLRLQYNYDYHLYNLKLLLCAKYFRISFPESVFDYKQNNFILENSSLVKNYFGGIMTAIPQGDKPDIKDFLLGYYGSITLDFLSVDTFTENEIKNRTLGAEVS